MKGHIRKRGKNSWAIILDLGLDSTGKRRQKWHTVRGPKRLAEAEAARLLNDLGNGAYVEPRKLTVAELLDKWLADSAGPNVAPKTLERYSEIVERHLKPALGKIPLAKLHPLHVQDYYTAALRSGRIRGGGELSPRTVLHHHRVLHRALKQGVKWQLLARNPADAVEPPRAVQKAIRVISESETADLLKLACETRLYVPLLVAIATGLRRGELLGLRWQDTDLSAGTIAVRQSLEQTAKGGLRFKVPKTRKGSRAVALPQFCVMALRSHKAAQAKERLAAGSAYSDQDLVFGRPDGTPWRPDVFTRLYRELIRQTKFEGLRFHDLRHSHATQLLRQGVHPKIVSERLGHATIGITLDTYSHVLPDMQEAAAAKLDAALGATIAADKKTGPSSR